MALVVHSTFGVVQTMLSKISPRVFGESNVPRGTPWGGIGFPQEGAEGVQGIGRLNRSRMGGKKQTHNVVK